MVIIQQLIMFFIEVIINLNYFSSLSLTSPAEQQEYRACFVWHLQILNGILMNPNDPLTSAVLLPINRNRIIDYKFHRLRYGIYCIHVWIKTIDVY